MLMKTTHNNSMRRLFTLFALASIASMLLGACAVPTASPNSSVNQSTQVAEAAYQTLTAYPYPTNTALPSTTPTPAETATPVATPTLPVVASGPTGFAANIDPLTGLAVSDPTILNRRPVMVKVANFPAAGRPHAGLSAADIVFEYFIGEGTNRFMALFYGQNAPKVGPIRSGRLVDAQLVPMYQGLLAYSGADPKVDNVIQNAIGKRAIADSPSTCPAVCDEGAHTVLSVFADTAKVTQYGQANATDPKTKPNLDGMSFDPAAPTTGKAGIQLAVQFNTLDRGEWRYDAASGTYLRWIESADANNNVTMVPLTDRNTNKQLAFNNVVVVFATYNQLAPTLHEINMNKNTAGQKAILFRDGKAIEGTWKSNGTDKPMSFFTSDGKAMAFKPGNSWIAIMGINSNVTEATGKWEVDFNLP
jgi:hypothetical protein